MYNNERRWNRKCMDFWLERAHFMVWYLFGNMLGFSCMHWFGVGEMMIRDIRWMGSEGDCAIAIVYQQSNN